MSEYLKNTPLPPAEKLAFSKIIVISDVNPVLADGMRLILQHDSYLNGFTMMSVTETDPTALARTTPDIVILDPWQSHLRGELIPESFAEIFSTTSLIAYCPEITTAEARSLMHAGFRGIIPKTLTSNDFIRAVVAVTWGGVYLHAGYSEPQEPSKPASTDPRDEGTDLSEREAEVLRHVALGSSMKEIANMLQISTKTVDTYKNRANQKLNLRSRSDIVRYAIQSGWMN